MEIELLVESILAAVERVAERQTGPGAKEFYLSVPRLLGLVT